MKLLGMALIAIIAVSGCLSMDPGIIDKDLEAGTLDEAITFNVISFTPDGFNEEQLVINVQTEKEYTCDNYNIEHDVRYIDNTIEISLQDVSEPEICLTNIGPASFRITFSIEEGAFDLLLYSKQGIDRYGIIVTDTTITVIEVDASFSEATRTSFERPRKETTGPKEVTPIIDQAIE
jgi:hypothetical protein